MLAREVYALNEKLENKVKDISKDQLIDAEQNGLLESLDQKDRMILKKSFCKQHQDEMKKRYPPLYSFSETEKNCFEFIHSLNFNNNFYSVKG